MQSMHPAIIRGYGSDDWIRHDTGDVIAGPSLTAAYRQILGDDTVAYVHIRSKFNCFQCRVDRVRAMGNAEATRCLATNTGALAG
jgi:hypothetical protein